MSVTRPTYEALVARSPKAPAVTASDDFFRLRWSLKGDDLYSSIAILYHATDANSPKEPYSPSHPISQSALTSPPVSAITVSIEILNDYAADWIGVHREHAEPEDSPDHDGERFDTEGIVEHCCGQDRPCPGPRIQIVADDFVSIGQFVEVVHPWLRGLDGQLRAAKGVQTCWPLDPAVDMYVWPSGPSPLRIAGREGQTAENWEYEWALLARTAAVTRRLRHDHP